MVAIRLLMLMALLFSSIAPPLLQIALAQTEEDDDSSSAPAFDGGDVVASAEAWLGVPYRFGGCSRRGIDCSCLVQLVYQTVGVSLPRTAAAQFYATARVAREDLLPGDLVFFANTYMRGISHVGIYIGDGLQINAPTEGKPVSVTAVFTGYWGQHLAGFGRILEDAS